MTADECQIYDENILIKAINSCDWSHTKKELGTVKKFSYRSVNL